MGSEEEESVLSSDVASERLPVPRSLSVHIQIALREHSVDFGSLKKKHEIGKEKGWWEDGE